MSIVSYFPPGRVPRPVQVAALEAIEQRWSQADVIVVNLPVAVGKSWIAYAIARWANQTQNLGVAITTPTNLLVNQYLRDFPRIPYINRADLYTCHTLGTGEYDLVDGVPQERAPTCAQVKQVNKRHCLNCTYVKHGRRSFASPLILANQYMYMARKLYRDVLIADEAHSLIGAIRDLNSKHYWIDQLHLPASIRSDEALHHWLRLIDKPGAAHLDILQEMERGKQRYVVSRTQRDYRGSAREALQLTPVDIRHAPPTFWPSRVSKLVLLSATINRTDIRYLGLDSKRVLYIEAESPIPASQRPVYLHCDISLSYRDVDANLPTLAERLANLMDHHIGERGIIHTTYSLMDKLRPLLTNDRIIWHTRENKSAQYQRFLETPGAVLVAAGMYEGIDLPEDLGRWQVITKCPWPSLADPAVKYMADQDEQWYSWETAKAVLQATGRVCRSPTDYGMTYILDSTFLRLYQNNPDMFPAWYQNSITL